MEHRISPRTDIMLPIFSGEVCPKVLSPHKRLSVLFVHLVCVVPKDFKMGLVIFIWGYRAQWFPIVQKVVKRVPLTIYVFHSRPLCPIYST